MLLSESSGYQCKNEMKQQEVFFISICLAYLRVTFYLFTFCDKVLCPALDN